MIHHIDQFPGRELLLQNKKYIYFGGTSYLGLQNDPDFQNIFINKIQKYGTNYGASRKSNIRLNIYPQVEDLLAKNVGCEKTLTLSSGYLAGQLVAQHFNTAKYKLFYAPNTHAALFNNYNKPYKNYALLKDELTSFLDENGERTAVLFLDSIDFDANSYPNFNALKSLPLSKVILVVDDSHGIGLIGENGGGIYRTIAGLLPFELIVCCSLGKSYALQAGAVFGTSKRIETIASSAFFGGASPAAPASIATFFESQSIFKKKREQLKDNIKCFVSAVNNIDFFKHMPNHPAFTFQDSMLASYLEERGFITTNFNYPEDSASVMSRIVISSHHTKKDLKDLATTLNSYFLK